MDAALVLLGVVVGGAVTFLGIVYTEKSRDDRARADRRRADQRETLRQIRDALLKMEDAGSDLLVEISEDWNGPEPKSERVWNRQGPTTESWRRYAHSSRSVTALRAELHDEDLRVIVLEYQERSGTLLVDEPASPSDEDVAAFKEISKERFEATARVIDNICTAYRSLG